jgi:hypothetical protein
MENSLMENLCRIKIRGPVEAANSSSAEFLILFSALQLLFVHYYHALPDTNPVLFCTFLVGFSPFDVLPFLLLELPQFLFFVSPRK